MDNTDIQKLSNYNIYYINKYVIDIIKELPETEETKFKIGKILNDSQIGFKINSLNVNFKLRLNVEYYLYKNEKSEYLSLIGPTEWNSKDTYIGCYKLNNNYIWINSN